MSKITENTRSTCFKCGKKRYREFMTIYSITSGRTRRFQWVCKPSCEQSFYKGEPTKGTNN